ncbi:PH domain-containing protein [Ornithinimicrobium kibberense]
MVANLADVTLEPIVRYRRTRWEVTGDKVFAQTGWLSRDQRIAPLSRVQTVDTHRGAIMRLYGLANVTVTTASAAGPITLPCLDSDVADRVTADLARITGQTRGDAT